MAYKIRGLGWLPDPYDHRDLYRHQVTKTLTVTERAFRSSGPREQGLHDQAIMANPPQRLPSEVDLSNHFTSIENQGEVGSCTAHAVVGLLEYLWNRTEQSRLDASRMFVYKATRNLLGWSGDTGAYVRAAVKAVRLFGACPEEHWPYHEEYVDEEPPAFCYAFGQHYRALQYYRLPETLVELRRSLAQGIPFAFGFTCYESLFDEPKDPANAGLIAYPKPNEAVTGGHAVVAVGYDDRKRRFKIRNSWGRLWGQLGYGWLPYEYFGREEDSDPHPCHEVSGKLATDCWCIVKTSYESLSFDELFESAGSGTSHRATGPAHQKAGRKPARKKNR